MVSNAIRFVSTKMNPIFGIEFAISSFFATSPNGLCPKGQGWEARAALGHRPEIAHLNAIAANACGRYGQKS